MIGWPELVLVLVIAFFIFGAGRVKELVRAVGEGMSEFKKATAETKPAVDTSDAAADETRK